MARIELSWLVKSSGRILGPFTTEKAAELLRSREISMLDEISTPGRRWQTLQYVDDFRDVIDSLRKASLSERTEVTWNQGGTNVTQTLTDLEAGTMTEEVSQSGFTSTAKEIVVHDLPEDLGAGQSLGQGRYQPQHGQNTAIQRQVEKTTRGLWLITLLALSLAAAFILRKRFAPNAAGPSAPPALRQSVIGMIQIGHYADALRELRSTVPDNAAVSDMSIYYGSLLIQLENQTVLGRRWLTGVVAAKRPELKQAYTGLGLADLIDNQVPQAIENLNAALKIDADYIPALVNLAAAHVKRGDFAKAREVAQRVLRFSPGQGEAMLLLAEASVLAHQRDPAAADLVGVGRQLKAYRQRQVDYAAEVGVYDLYLDHLRREPASADQLRAYLDRDPQLTTDHRHNVFIYRGRFQWSELARRCEQMTGQLGGQPLAAVFLASCYAHENRWDAARAAVERAVHQGPKDALIQAWYSYVLRESGDVDQASVVLGRATEFNRHGDVTLPSLLQARFCQQAGLTDCARTWWQKIFERDLENISALGGLALLYWNAGSRAEATTYVAKGLKVSPDYIPLLELKAKGEGGGSASGAN